MLYYDKMYYNGVELQRLYRGSELIWEKSPSPSFMPYMDSVTNYYDSKDGLTLNSWKNQISGGNDITWTGMEIQNDGSAGVYGKDYSYGRFTSTYTPQRTIYAIFKMPLIGDVQGNPHVVSSCGGNLANYRRGAWFSIAVDGYSENNYIQSDQWGIGIGSSITCEDYHVACLTRDDRNMNMLYVDGLIASNMSSSVAYSDNFGVGVTIDEYGNVGEGPLVLQQILFIAVAATAHTSAQVEANSAWLRDYYNL